MEEIREVIVFFYDERGWCWLSIVAYLTKERLYGKDVEG